MVLGGSKLFPEGWGLVTAQKVNSIGFTRPAHGFYGTFIAV